MPMPFVLAIGIGIVPRAMCVTTRRVFLNGPAALVKRTRELEDCAIRACLFRSFGVERSKKPEFVDMMMVMVMNRDLAVDVRNNDDISGAYRYLTQASRYILPRSPT